MQFSLRSLLLFVACCAAFLSFAVTVGWVEAVGTAIAVVLFVCAYRCYRKKQRIVLGTLGAIVGLALVWFVGVDCSWFNDYCEHCNTTRSVMQYRVYGFPISESIKVFPTPAYNVGRDLGVVCKHDFRRWHRERDWGLLFPGFPCIAGTFGLIYEYDKETAACVRKLAEADPSLRLEFQKRVFQDHDYRWFWALYQRIEAMKPSRPEAQREGGMAPGR